MPDKSSKGWWPDPGGSGRLRWWDGSAWTRRVRDLPPDPDGEPAPDPEWGPPTLPDQVVMDESVGRNRSGGWMKYAAGALGLLLLVGLLAGAYLVGQGTRKSDAQVAEEKRVAVAAAISVTRHKDALRMERAVDKQKRRTRVVARRIVRKLKKAAERKAQQSYASGQSAGYSSGNAAGYSAGTQDGLVQGSDQLTCSDDPDVGWLPYC